MQSVYTVCKIIKKAFLTMAMKTDDKAGISITRPNSIKIGLKETEKNKALFSSNLYATISLECF